MRPTRWRRFCLPAFAPLLLALLLGPGCGADNAMDSGLRSELTLAISGKQLPAPGETVKVTAEVGSSYQVAAVLWQVSDPDGKQLDFAETGELTPGITFAPRVEGTHQVNCKVRFTEDSGTVTAKLAVQVVDPNQPTLRYTARILPPADSGLPVKDVPIDVGRVDQTSLRWTVEQGRCAFVQVVDSSGGALPATLRLFRDGVDPLPLDVSMPDGLGQNVCAAGTFHALVLPASGTVAPYLKTFNSALSLTQAWTITVPSGDTVQGTIVGPAGALTGATVSLTVSQAGVDVPSTLGTTDAAGGYTLSTRAGKARLVVVPPPGSGLPVARVSDKDLEVSGDHSGWNLTYKQVSMVTLSGKVTRSDGSSPVSGATVRLTAKDPKVVATLALDGGKTYDAAALGSLELATDGAGRLVDPRSGATSVRVPDGQYTVDLWPGSTTPQAEGFHRETLVLTGGGKAELTLALTPRVKVTGNVVDAAGKPVPARVQAVGPSGAFADSTDTQGRFALLLDDKLTYRLSVLPESYVEDAASYVNPAQPISGGGTVLTVTLPRAVVLSGRVVSSTGGAIAGALVRVWCSGSGCPGDEVVDQVRTSASGAFHLRVPPAGGGAQ